MVFREVSVIEIREALRAWLAGKSERAVAAQAGVDRKTSKRYVTAAVAAGLSRAGGEEQLTDELIGQVVSVVRPVRPDGHGAGRAELKACLRGRRGRSRGLRRHHRHPRRRGHAFFLDGSVPEVAVVRDLPCWLTRRWQPARCSAGSCSCPRAEPGRSRSTSARRWSSTAS